MASLESPLLLLHPTRDVSIDATTMGLAQGDLDGLAWDAAFDAMAALEAGAVANPDQGRQVGHYWLRNPELAPSAAIGAAVRAAITSVMDLASRVRSGALTTPEGHPFTDVVHVGIGGSALGPQLLLDALGSKGGLEVHFLDNIDPDGVARVLDRLGERIATSLVVVVSKSGNTPETVHGAALAFERMVSHGVDPEPRAVAITAPGSPLHIRAADEGWLATLPLWDWVGGRTSVTGTVGLLPAAFAGIDVEGFLQGARQMDTWTRRRDWRANPAALLAGCWHRVGHGRGDRAMVVLPYCDRLRLLSRYLQQLVMESVGQRCDLAGNEVRQGLTVYGNKGSTDQHAFVQQLRDGRDDFFVTFVQVLRDGRGSSMEVAAGENAGDFLQGFLLGTRQALADDGRPSLVITVEQVDAWALGALVALFERAVGLYAALIGINPYHQPGVEAGKQAARSVLDLSREIRESLSADWISAEDLATRLSAEPTLVFHVLQRLVFTERAQREGAGISARYRAP